VVPSILFGDILSGRRGLAMSELTMTVRTYAAIHALPAVLMMQTELAKLGINKEGFYNSDYTVEQAVKLADALIAELAKEYDHET
jgi:hypothetical protein